jgi:hypothetical protein
MFARSGLRSQAARVALAVLLGGALVSHSSIALAGGAASPPASLAGVDFLPARPGALYPGGTAFASVSMDGANPNLTVTDAAGSTLAIRDAGSGSNLLAWDGRDVDGTPIRAGNARLQFQHRKESHMIELRSIRWAMHAASGVTFIVRATAR